MVSSASVAPAPLVAAAPEQAWTVPEEHEEEEVVVERGRGQDEVIGAQLALAPGYIASSHDVAPCRLRAQRHNERKFVPLDIAQDKLEQVLGVRQ